MQQLFVFLFVSTSISSPLVAAALTSGAGDVCCDNPLTCQDVITCTPGLKCCYLTPGWMDSVGKCYDPQTDTCSSCPAPNPAEPRASICPISSPTCCTGHGCIPSGFRCCHIPNSFYAFTCRADRTCCGIVYNGAESCCESYQTCVNGQCQSNIQCGNGEVLCRNACFKPDQYVCTVSGILCPINAPLLCGNACYSDSQYSCIVGVFQPVNADQSPKHDTTTTPPPTTAPTTTTTLSPTSIAPNCAVSTDDTCGSRCYNRMTHVCADATTELLCPITSPQSCDSSCYSPFQYVCFNGQLQPVVITTHSSNPNLTSTSIPSAATIIPITCGHPGDQVCGSHCYNPSNYVCADDTYQSGFLCPINHPDRCEDACYASTQYLCVDGHLFPK